MSENNGTTKFAYLIAGMGIGAILALLFAPKSGEESREFIRQRAREGKDFLASKSQEFRSQADDYVEKGKDLVAKQKEQLSAALEAGKQAYQETKAKAH